MEFLMHLATQLLSEKVHCSLIYTNIYTVLRVEVDVRHSLQ